MELSVSHIRYLEEKCQKLGHLIPLEKMTISKDTIDSLGELGRFELFTLLKDKLDKDGFLLIDLNLLTKNQSITQSKKTVLVFLASFLKPFGIFNKYGLVREIGVDINKDYNSSTGIGHIPLHCDFNNTSQPPKYSILYSYRVDPFRGGESTLSNFNKVLEKLSSNEIIALKNEEFSEGDFYNLSNVGHHLDKFSVISSRNQPIRFSAKLRTRESNKPLLWKIRKELIKSQETFMLEKGMLLIINQCVFVHGRHSLNSSQSGISKEKSRLLLQFFADDFKNE